MALEKFHIAHGDRFTAESQYTQRRQCCVRRDGFAETTKGRRQGIEDGDTIVTHPFAQRCKSQGSEIVGEQRSAIEESAIHVSNRLCITKRMPQRYPVFWAEPSVVGVVPRFDDDIAMTMKHPLGIAGRT